ncbi:MAG: hypothetical protein H0V89_14030 [Deltaproteobacteria bacterium]|nr:hypothetical protein [Deltaproteobacteria bacterium]
MPDPTPVPDDDLTALWYAVGTRDYFAVPPDAAIPEGDLTLRAIRGVHDRHVDRDAIAPFAIPREEATRRLQIDAARQLAHARDAVGRLVEIGVRIPGQLVHPPDLEGVVDSLGKGLADLARRFREGRRTKGSTEDDSIP